MKSFLFCLILVLSFSSVAQTTAIKENLGSAINTAEDQILPVFSLDGNTLYFSENGADGRYEIWSSQRDEKGNWQAKQKAKDLNPPTNGSKYVFAHVEVDLFLVNGWFEQTGDRWTQTKGLSWYIPSQKKFVKLDIPDLQTQVNGRFVNAFLHLPSKTLLLSYAENDRKNLYICQPENPSGNWIELRWQSPKRFPAPLNSEFDDTTPFLDVDGTILYFASNRPGGYGETDIYSSRRLDDSWMQWSSPENLGFGVNSNFSEIYYSISPQRDFVHFVSYKYSYGSGDIFRLQTNETQPTLDPVTSIRPDIVKTTQQVAIPEPEKLTELVEVSPTHIQSEEETELTVAQYKPNNLVFLIDRSGSMQPDDKLPLLKLSLKRLIGELRDIDRFTLMSFADSAVTHFSTKEVTQKDSLYHVIDKFKADGNTKANQGLQLAYDYTRQNFIGDGNNEIILVTDGQFRLSAQDQKMIEQNRRIVLSVIGLGNDPRALSNLQRLAARASGSFIHILSAETATEALLEEVKARSRR